MILFLRIHKSHNWINCIQQPTQEWIMEPKDSFSLNLAQSQVL